jgi:hypothetical protein
MYAVPHARGVGSILSAALIRFAALTWLAALAVLSRWERKTLGLAAGFSIRPSFGTFCGV